MFKKLFIFLMFWSVVVFGQQGLVGSYLRLNPTSLPGICRQGDVRFDTGTSFLQTCTPANTWNALSMGAFVYPLTTLGDTLYDDGMVPHGTRLPGNITTTKQFLTQTGTGSVSAAPIWDVIIGADLPYFVGGVLPIANGGTGTGATPSNGEILIGNGTNYTKTLLTPGTGVSITNGAGNITISASGGASAMPGGITFANGTVGASASAGALTASLFQQDGSTDPASGGNAVSISMRSSIATSAAFNTRTITSALTQVLSSGTTLGLTASVNQPVWFYLIDSDGAGTMKLGAASVLYDERSLQDIAPESVTVTIPIGSTTFTSSSAHGLKVGDAITFTTTGALPTGLVAGTVYYIYSAGTPTTFQVSAGKFPNGFPVNPSGSQSGVQTMHVAAGRLVSDAKYLAAPIRVVGKGMFNLATPGTWLAPVELNFPRMQPGSDVFCFVKGDSTFTLASGAFNTTAITMEILVNDLWNMCDGNGQMTMPFDGIWQFSAGLEFGANGTGGRGLVLNINGSADITNFGAASATDVIVLTQSVTMYAPKGATFFIGGFQRSGGNLGVGSGDGATWSSAKLLQAY